MTMETSTRLMFHGTPFEPAKSPPRPGDAGDASGGSNQSNHSTGDAGTGDGALDELAGDGELMSTPDS